MTNLSFLDGCLNCLERGHKSWESYFSKWDFLAKNEETITESGLVEELNENIDERKRVKKTKNIDQKKKVNKVKKKEPTQRKSKISKKLPLKSSANKLLLRKERTIIHRKGKTKAQKKKKTQKVKKVMKEAEIVEAHDNYQDDSDIKQIEVDLRSVFLNILKENKTKWEIFGVLSQTISRNEMTIKTYHELEFSPKLTNGISYSGKCPSLTNQDIVPVASLNDKMAVFGTRSVDVRLNSLKSPNRMIEVLDGSQILNNLRRAGDSECSSSSVNLNQTFPLDKYNKTDYSCVSPYRALDPFYQTPKVDFKMMNGISKGIYNVKNLTHSYLNNSQNESEKRLKPFSLNLSGTSEGSEGSKININKLSFLKAPFSDVPQMNGRREKTFQNLCLHKRTSDVSLNMGNSNFVTPKRNPSERKCFSENILQGKKRGRSKLSFFDYIQDDDDSDSDDPSENRCPVIRWESKKPKIEEIIVDDSDSEDLESIFDRVRKP